MRESERPRRNYGRGVAVQHGAGAQSHRGRLRPSGYRRHSHVRQQRALRQYAPSFSNDSCDITLTMRQKIVLVALLAAAPAVFALNSRSAVSLSGVDTNPCTTTLPCRSFSAAVARTLDGGEIVALDTAGYGPFTIDRSLTVGGAPGVHAAIT